MHRRARGCGTASRAAVCVQVELKKLQQAERIEELMVRAGELHDAIEAEIAELEELAVTLKPAVPGEEEPTRH